MPPIEPLTYDRLIKRLEETRATLHQSYKGPEHAARLMELDNMALEALNTAYRGSKGEEEEGLTPAELKHRFQDVIRIINAKHDLLTLSNHVDSDKIRENIAELDSFLAEMRQLQHEDKSEAHSESLSEEEFDPTPFMDMLEATKQVFIANNNPKTQMYKDAMWVFKGASPRIEMADSKYEARAILHEVESTLKKLTREHKTRIAFAARREHAHSSQVSSRLQSSVPVSTHCVLNFHQLDVSTPLSHNSVTEQETGMKRISDIANEATPPPPAKRAKASLTLNLLPIPSLHPAMTQGEVFRQAVQWMGANLERSYPLPSTEEHQMLLTNIIKHVHRAFNIHNPWMGSEINRPRQYMQPNNTIKGDSGGGNTNLTSRGLHPANIEHNYTHRMSSGHPSEMAVPGHNAIGNNRGHTDPAHIAGVEDEEMEESSH
jgi:hypothetical protein